MHFYFTRSHNRGLWVLISPISQKPRQRSLQNAVTRWQSIIVLVSWFLHTESWLVLFWANLFSKQRPIKKAVTSNPNKDYTSRVSVYTHVSTGITHKSQDCRSQSGDFIPRLPSLSLELFTKFTVTQLGTQNAARNHQSNCDRHLVFTHTLCRFASVENPWIAYYQKATIP